VVLQCSAINEIDASAIESLEAINEKLHSMNVSFHLSEVKGPVMDRLNRIAFTTHISGQVFLSHMDAVKALTADIPSHISVPKVEGASPRSYMK
jgi:SulP family sulfate permease